MIYTHGKVSLGIDTIGGNITSFQYDGEHIFFPQQILKENNELKIRGGSHICFPNFGKAPENHDYKLPKHGIIRNARNGKLKEGSLSPSLFQGTYRIKLREEVSDIPFVEFIVDSMGIQPATSPYNFQLSSRCYFLSNGFVQLVNVFCHEGEIEDIPIGLGLHVYFNAPTGSARITFPNSPMLFIAPHDKEIYQPLRPLGHPQTPNAELEFEANKTKVKIRYGGLFADKPDSKIVLWRHSSASPYVCIEPILSEPENFGVSGKCYFLQPNRSVSVWMMVTVE